MHISFLFLFLCFACSCNRSEEDVIAPLSQLIFELSDIPENSVKMNTNKLFKYKNEATNNKIAVDRWDMIFTEYHQVSAVKEESDEEKQLIKTILNKTTENSDTIYNKFIDTFEAMYCSNATQEEGQKIYDSAASKWYTIDNVKYMINADINDLSVYYKDSEKVRELYKTKQGMILTV